MKSSFYVEFGSKKLDEKELYNLVKKEWTDAGNKVKDISSISVYVKPEESAMYYVINDTTSGCIPV